MKYIASILFIAFLVTGCSTKKYFEPEDTQDIDLKSASLKSEILKLTRDGATLKNGSFISQKGISKIQLKEGYSFLNHSNTNEIISTNLKDSISINEKNIELKNVAIAASKKENILATIYSDNSIELRDINSNQILLKEYNSVSLANDTRITNPIFLGKLVLYPTLDGKILVVSIKQNQIIKKISVDANGQFNNIIFLDVMDDGQTLISATANKLVIVSANDILNKKYEIKDLAINGDFIYLATLDGRVIKLDKSLNEVASKKYKFAKFNAIAYSNKNIYALEAQGYLVKIDEAFKTSTVYDFDYDYEDKIITISNRFFVGDRQVVLP